MKETVKVVVWVGSSKKDLSNLPADVINDVGFGLYQAPLGKHPDSGKTLSGFGSADVVELKVDHKGDTFRSIYTVRFVEAVFVLHVFKKKSSTGISTSKKDVDLVKSRLKLAEEIYKELKKGRKL